MVCDDPVDDDDDRGSVSLTEHVVPPQESVQEIFFKKLKHPTVLAASSSSLSLTGS